MKINTSDKIMAYLALFSGLTISAVAIYYSVAGLVAIFAASVMPIIVMGVVLEVSKLVATVWLKLNWHRAPLFIRTYLLVAIAILMLITSMGIFGFLSKAHSNNSLISGDVQSRIAVYDEKIKTQNDNIEAARKALKQLDEGVDQVLGRSTSETGASRAVALRKSQQKERAQLQAEIQKSQQSISQLADARAPIAAEVRKVEAEVGPVKYIASFIYGSNPDTNILEKAVTWVIIIIVSVFDPLAIILLLASQYSFQWFRKEKEQQESDETTEFFDKDKKIARDNDKYDAPLTDEQINNLADQARVEPSLYEEIPTHTEKEIPPTPSTALGGDITAPEETVEEISIDQWNMMIAEAEIAIEADEDSKIINAATVHEQTAMTRWKKENPDSSLKIQRHLLRKGVIKELPWTAYIDTVNHDAEEARKWAEENPQTSESTAAKEWAEEVTYMENVDGEQVKKTLDGYQQNAEQGENTLWQRIKKGN
jgi:hypothetical protein